MRERRRKRPIQRRRRKVPVEAAIAVGSPDSVQNRSGFHGLGTVRDFGSGFFAPLLKNGGQFAAPACQALAASITSRTVKLRLRLTACWLYLVRRLQ